MSRKEKITLIILGIVTAALLISAVMMLSGILTEPEDDGKIFKGVMVAGVDLGGMTKEEAAIALSDATIATYTKQAMVVEVLGSKIVLAPKDTGAKLNVAAAVEEAYQYGRTGSRAEREQAKSNALANSVNVPITQHLNLNLEYIKQSVEELGAQFSTSLTPPTIVLQNKDNKPNVIPVQPDTTTVYQTIVVYVGTPEYNLDTNKLYQQVLDNYNINNFKVVGDCPTREPDSWEPELLTYYNDLCVEPIDARTDPITNEDIREKYGYGFDWETEVEAIRNTPYGETYTIQLRFLRPALTLEDINTSRFNDVLGSYSAPLGSNAAWNSNVTNACHVLNNLFLKPGETFSFNDLLGALTKENGYVDAMALHGRVNVLTMGGGVTHVASALYASALAAELEIVERYSHPYIPGFIETGLDAYVDEGKNFRFTNNMRTPIRIRAEVVNGTLNVRIEGADTRNYWISLTTKQTEVIQPGVLYNTMLPSNPGGYGHDYLLDPGQVGCVVEVYKVLYDSKTNQMQNERFYSVETYEARDMIKVKIEQPVIPPDPSVPTEPSIPTGPSLPAVPMV